MHSFGNTNSTLLYCISHMSPSYFVNHFHAVLIYQFPNLPHPANISNFNTTFKIVHLSPSKQVKR